MTSQPFRGISHCRVYARPDGWQACVDFHETKIGCRLQHADPDTGVAVFAFGNGTFFGVGRAGADDAESAAGVFTNVSIAVDDVAALHCDLAGTGVAFLGAPERQPWDGTHFRDPARNVVTRFEYARG